MRERCPKCGVRGGEPCGFPLSTPCGPPRTMTTPDTSHRVAAFVITPETLMGLFSRTHFYRFVGLPKDAKVLAVHYDSARRAFVLQVEHESFDEVELGSLIPEKGPILVQSLPLRQFIDSWRENASDPDLTINHVLDDLEKSLLPIDPISGHLVRPSKEAA